MIDTKKLNKIGIDRVTIDVNITAIDTLKLGDSLYSIGYADNKDNICLDVLDRSTNTIKRIKTMKIMYTLVGSTVATKEKDIVKYGIEIKTKKNNLTGSVQNVAVLDLVFGRIAYDTTHNIYNVHDSITAKNSINRIINELCINGIELSDPTTWSITTLEINKTVQMANALEHYSPGMNWLFDKASNKSYFKEDVRHRKNNKDNSKSLTYKYKTKRRETKFYDKTCNIKDTLNIYIDENLIRLETKLNKEAINIAFNSNNITLLYDIDKIKKIFNSTVDSLSNVTKKLVTEEINLLLDQFTLANYKELERIYKANASSFLDILFLLEAAAITYKRFKNPNLQRDIKKLLKCIDQNLFNSYSELINLLIAFKPDIETYVFSKSTMKYL